MPQGRKSVPTATTTKVHDGKRPKSLVVLFHADRPGASDRFHRNVQAVFQLAYGRPCFRWRNQTAKHNRFGSKESSTINCISVRNGRAVFINKKNLQDSAAHVMRIAACAPWTLDA